MQAALRIVAGFGILAITSWAASVDDRLIQAVKHQDEGQARGLLEQRIDVNAAQGDGSTALHYAAYNDNLAIAQMLLRAGARADAANDLGATPLQVACGNGDGRGSAAMVDLLLASNANPNAKLLNGETVLMTCARTGNTSAVKSLLVHGADPKAAEPEHNQTALMWAAAEKHPDVTALLIEFGADVKARAREYSMTVVGEQTQRAGREELNYDVMRGGSTALLFAARSGDAESAKLLLEHGADPNDALPDGTSALVLAAHSGQRDVALVLLDKGANPNDLGIGYAALHAAVLRGDLTLVKALLAKGADPNLKMTKGTPTRRNSTDYNLLAPLVGATPYLLAAKFLEPEIMKSLLAGGADPKTTMPNGATALMLAAGMNSAINEDRRGVNVIDYGKPEPESKVIPTIEAALAAGGDINTVNNRGDTALHAAVTHRYEAAIQLLVGRGANVNARNKSGQTPLALASGPPRNSESPTASTKAGAGSSGTAIADQPEARRIAALLRSLGAN